jgi:hypothetical protein
LPNFGDVITGRSDDGDGSRTSVETNPGGKDDPALEALRSEVGVTSDSASANGPLCS